MAKMVMVEALADLSYSPDGTTTAAAKKGQTFALAEDTAIQLESLETPLIKRAAEDAKADPVTVSEGGVEQPLSLSSQVSSERTKISEEGEKALAELRAAEAGPAMPPKPDIEPVEHGDVTIDRTLTRGVHGDAVQVEDADAAASAGKTTAVEEITEIQEDDAGSSPENKAGKRRK